MEAGSSTAKRQRTAQPSTPRKRCARPREISRTPAARPPQRASAGGDRTGVRVKEVAPLGAAASEVAFLIPATRRSQTMRDVFRSCSKYPPRGFLRFSSKLHCCCVFLFFVVWSTPGARFEVEKGDILLAVDGAPLSNEATVSCFIHCYSSQRCVVE